MKKFYYAYCNLMLQVVTYKGVYMNCVIYHLWAVSKEPLKVHCIETLNKKFQAQYLLFEFCNQKCYCTYSETCTKVMSLFGTFGI